MKNLLEPKSKYKLGFGYKKKYKVKINANPITNSPMRNPKSDMPKKDLVNIAVIKRKAYVR